MKYRIYYLIQKLERLKKRQDKLDKVEIKLIRENLFKKFEKQHSAIITLFREKDVN